MKITLSHPHGSLFSYQAARALSENARLGSFRTGVTGGAWAARLLARASHDSRQRLLNRCYDDIPRDRQYSYLCWEALSRAGRRLKTGGPTAETTWYDVLFCGHDWQASRGLEKDLDAVYAYEDGARLTFEAARRRDVARVYELPLGYFLGVAEELTRSVRERPDAGLKPWSEPAWKQERKNAELELADLVVVPCEWARETLRLSKSLNKRVIKVPYATPADEVAVRGGQPGGPFTIFFAGQVGVRKGVPLLLEAWERLGLKDARLLMAGSMSLDEKYLSRRAGVEYLGALPRVRLLELMKGADLFVFPSLAEGFGLVIGEAMAAGVPVLTTTNTGGPELISDGREGWCVPAHDVDALAERIEWAYQNRDALYGMGMLGRRRAERWTWADYRKKLAHELSRNLAA
jgi:glycosyltransferase involved in cell wall biosynthesis